MNRKIKITVSLFIVILLILGIIYRITHKKEDAVIYEGLSVMMEGTEISALYDDGERLWVGTSEGIYLLDNGSGEMIKKLDADIQMIYTAMIVETNDSLVWAGHDSGISMFDTEGNIVCEYRNPQIPEGRVNALLNDGDTLWAGTQNGAVCFRSDNGTWKIEKILTRKDGLAEDTVQVITKINDELWFGSYLGTDKGGISILKDGKWSYLSTDDGIPHRYINAILQTDGNSVLIGSGQLIEGGLSLAEKKDGKWTVTSNWDQNDGIPGMKVRMLFKDSKGRLWITTEADGILILEDTDSLNTRPLKGVILKQENGLSDDEIKCITESKECYWLGGKNGLTRYDKQKGF